MDEQPTSRRVRLTVLWVGAVVLLGAVASGGRAEDLELTIGGRRGTLVLPSTPHWYARNDLPDHFPPAGRRPGPRRGVPPSTDGVTDAGATLGRVLFYDTRLSADDSMSCASCHRQEHAFADPRRVSRGIHGDRGRRNSMSLVNLRWHRGGFFWDERAPTLEAQVLMPIEDPKEMAFEVEALIARLELDPRYALLFRDAYGDPSVTRDRLAGALASFVRSIVSHRSRFDEGMAAAESAAADFESFTAQENEGKRVFFGLHDDGGRVSCASCHALTTGKVALFIDRQARNNGLDEASYDSDRGLAETTGDAADVGLFKIPTLRNVELTAPYMHDGRLRTLKDVIDHYRRGVQPHPNLDRRLAGRGRRAGGPRPMRITVKQRRALIAFLETLTDEALLEDERFSNPWR